MMRSLAYMPGPALAMTRGLGSAALRWGSIDRGSSLKLAGALPHFGPWRLNPHFRAIVEATAYVRSSPSRLNCLSAGGAKASSTSPRTPVHS